MSTYTLTFSECVENHKGMQKYGIKRDQGFSLDDLLNVKTQLETKGVSCEIIHLNELLTDEYKADNAYILVVRNILSNHIELFEEQKNLEMDKKAFMKGRVVNKIARWNLCFAEVSQEPDYAAGKGRLINFNDVPLLKNLRDMILELTGENLYCEGNYYYDINKCYIGEHGDTERSLVVGCRLGEPFYLAFRWFQKTEPISDFKKIVLNSGDMYMMSHKTTGNDWMKKNIPTLRHSAFSDESFKKVNNK